MIGGFETNLKQRNRSLAEPYTNVPHGINNHCFLIIKPMQFSEEKEIVKN